MTNDFLEKILSTLDDYKGKLKTLRLTFGLKILVIIAVLLTVSYQLFFVLRAARPVWDQGRPDRP